VIQVLDPGCSPRLQDLGREGFDRSEFSSPFMRVGLRFSAADWNRLVGHAEGSAGLEMTLLGDVSVPEGSVLALTGSDFGATLDGAPVDYGVSFERTGQTLLAGATKRVRGAMLF